MRRRAPYLFAFALVVTEICSCGGGNPPPPVTVTVTTTATTVPVNSAALFTAVVTNSSNQNVTWAVAGGSTNGTISASGLYTAPAAVPSNPQVTVTATPQANPTVSGQASITVTVAVSVSPASATMQTLATTQFSARVQGSANQNVTWEVDGVAGGNATVGVINSAGIYEAPESVPVNATAGQTTFVTISAAAQVNPAASASAAVTITSSNQLAQNLPVELGTSGGNINDEDATECAGGTLGSLVVRAGTQYILSDNHVLARSDAASLGEAIIQPGLIDTPSPCSSAGSNTVAHLSQFINLEQPAGCTTNCSPPADAAIAQAVSGAVDTSGNIIELGDSSNGSGVPSNGPPASTILPVSSLIPNTTAVAKSGRSTGLTCGVIEATSLDVQVQYQHGLGGYNFTAMYQNQIAVNGGTFSAAGDSGSLIVSQAGAQPVALLFAGSSSETVGTPVATVLANLADSNNNTPTFVGPASRNPVVGCTSSGAVSFSASKSQDSSVKPSAAEISQAEVARDQRAHELMSDPAVLALGVDGSLDRPGHAAIIVFVQTGEPLVQRIPHAIDGVLTRVVTISSVPQAGVKTGLLGPRSTVEILKTLRRSAAVHPTPQRLAAATSVKNKYAGSLLGRPGILGVGVSASLDDPSEAAIIVYVESGKTHAPIPLELGGVRVRVKSTSKFRAYGWGRPRSYRIPSHHAGASLSPLR